MSARASSSGSGSNTVHAAGCSGVGLVVLAIGWALLLHRRLAARASRCELAAAAAARSWSASTASWSSWSPARCCSPRTSSRCSGASSSRCSATAWSAPPSTAATTCCWSAVTPGAGRWGLRTDSMTVASIDEDTGKHRALRPAAQHDELPVPRGLVDGQAVPARLRLRDLRAQQPGHLGGRPPDLFERLADPGIDATIQGIEGITGLKINYYAMVNLAGLPRPRRRDGRPHRSTCATRIPIGGGEQGQIGTIEPGVQKLNGYQVAVVRPVPDVRRRLLPDGAPEVRDERDARSSCSPQTVITKFEALAKAGESTAARPNLPASELDTFAQLALKARVAEDQLGVVRAAGDQHRRPRHRQDPRR